MSMHSLPTWPLCSSLACTNGALVHMPQASPSTLPADSISASRKEMLRCCRVLSSEAPSSESSSSLEPSELSAAASAPGGSALLPSLLWGAGASTRSARHRVLNQQCNHSKGCCTWCLLLPADTWIMLHLIDLVCRCHCSKLYLHCLQCRFPGSYKCPAAGTQVAGDLTCSWDVGFSGSRLRA